ncbi:MAG: hypothetical protein ACT4O0_16775 [Pseudonocardia sp.]|jgi:hypothetical protein
MSDQDDRAIVAAAASGYPPGQVHPLFIRRRGEHAVVLLETGSGGHSYPYFVQCRFTDGRWCEGQSSNMPGWYQTEDDAGVVVFWDDAEGLAEPIEVEFKGQRWPAEVNGGVCFMAWWDELDPSNYIEPHWPSLAERRLKVDSAAACPPVNWPPR